MNRETEELVLNVALLIIATRLLSHHSQIRPLGEQQEKK